MYNVRFKTKETRNLFFDSVKKKFGNWKNIYTNLGIGRDTLWRYKVGKNLMPLESFNLLNKYVNLKERNITKVDSNWGQKLGGKITYKKNKWIFELGRKKMLGVHKQTENKTLDLDLNSPELAEFIGVLLGDGFIGIYGRVRMIQITGNKINDRKYYKEYLMPLIKKVFNTKVYFYDRETCIRLTIYSKVVFNTIRKVFNFPVGKKGEIKIPENIIQNKKCKISLVRGIFDTDGTIYLERKKYPIISITTISKIMAEQIQEILNEFGFGAYICKSKNKTKGSFRVTVFGKQKVLKWKNLIGSSNPYHMDRIKASVAQIS